MMDKLKAIIHLLVFAIAGCGFGYATYLLNQGEYVELSSAMYGMSLLMVLVMIYDRGKS